MEVLASWTCKQLAVVVFDVAGTGQEAGKVASVIWFCLIGLFINVMFWFARCTRLVCTTTHSSALAPKCGMETIELDV